MVEGQCSREQVVVEGQCSRELVVVEGPTQVQILPELL